MHKLVEVIKINNITGEEFVERGMALFKIITVPEKRLELLQLVEIFRGHVLDLSPDSLIVEATGSEKKIAAFEEALRPFGITELVRTGSIAMVRGGKIKLK